MVIEHEDEADQWWDDDGTEGLEFDVEPKPVHARIAWRTRHAVRRLRSRAADIRSQWQPGVTVAAVEYAHKGVLADEPRLRNLIDVDLRRKIDAEYPLRWRYDDFRWHLRQTRIAATGGRPELTAPWHEEVTMQISDDSADFFERNQVAILVQSVRMPRGTYLWGPRVITDRWLNTKHRVRMLRERIEEARAS